MPKKPIKLSTRHLNPELPILEKLRNEYIRENYTPLGEKRPNWVSELEWEKMQ